MRPGCIPGVMVSYFSSVKIVIHRGLCLSGRNSILPASHLSSKILSFADGKVLFPYDLSKSPVYTCKTESFVTECKTGLSSFTSGVLRMGLQYELSANGLMP
jgi:hypothetical protein